MWYKHVILNLVLLIGIFKSSYDNVLRWMPHDLTDDRSTLLQVMAWCRQATRHYLSQCWHISLPPYGVNRPKWVNINTPHSQYMPPFRVETGQSYHAVLWQFRIFLRLRTLDNCINIRYQGKYMGNCCRYVNMEWLLLYTATTLMEFRIEVGGKVLLDIHVGSKWIWLIRREYR